MGFLFAGAGPEFLDRLPNVGEFEDGTFEVCSLCRGTGNIGSHLCPDCAGRCIVPHECRAEALARLRAEAERYDDDLRQLA